VEEEEEGEEEEEEAEEGEDRDAADVEQLRRLFYGIVVRKHGRRGWPKETVVWIDARHSEIVLRWGRRADRRLDYPPLDPEVTPDTMPDRVMRFGEVLSVGEGAQGPVLGSRTGDPNAGRFVSLVSERRSFDMEMSSPVEAREFALAMGRFVGDRAVFSAAIMHLFNNGLLPPDEYPTSAGAGEEGAEAVADEGEATEGAEAAGEPDA